MRFTCSEWSSIERATATALRRAANDRELLVQLERERAQSAELLRSNRELDRYADVIAHDLAAPVRGIAAFSELMDKALEQGNHQEASARAKTVGRSARSLSAMVRSLLAYSKAGQIDKAIADVELEALALEQLQRLAPFLEIERATVTVESGLPRVRCDQVRIATVLDNLITNAVKYNSRADKRVRVFCREDAGPVVCVADNGFGIPERDRERVFELFVRLHAPETYGGGSGMGLAISRKIVESHGGRLWIDETSNEGTTFAFTLSPRAEVSSLRVRGLGE